MSGSAKNIKLLVDWNLISSKDIAADGSLLSTGDIDLNNWYKAEVPSTVLAALVMNDVYKDPYFGTNLKEIPTEQFKVPWWYRTEFEITKDQAEQIVLLALDGINYKANIWLNGKLVADKEVVYGAYRRFQFNISSHLQPGKNILAIEVIPPKDGDFTIGFVDWNPNPPDDNVGIFRNVSLQFNKGVSVENPFVESKVDYGSGSAELTVLTELVNHTGKTYTGTAKGRIGDIEFEKTVEAAPNQKTSVQFSPDEFEQLKFADPKLWWPNNLGDPNLYELELDFIADNEVLHSTNIKFGIRQIEDYVNDGGHRGFKINGHKLLIKGGGWTDDLLLQDTHETLQTQIEYVKHMNLNCIRLEGFWGKDQKLYDLCDENGILIMVGWSCQWEHEQYLGKPVDPRYGGVIEPDEIDLVGKYWEDQLLWLRHHPSIFVWTIGSDLLPHPDLERKYIETFDKYDSTRPYLNSTGGIGSEQGIISTTEIISEISGSSRVKMLGPYAYTPPVYWYTNKNLGGAYGFNTETCPGANVQPLESIKKMIPEEHLWQIDEVWDFHCGKNEFATIDRFREAVDKRYGTPNDVEEFTMKAQALNYELMRPMFEAFQANKKNATGIIQWMLNSAWPEMYWQLYGHDLMPNGAFYGAKTACEPIHLLYDYGNNSIKFVNDTFNEIKDYNTEIKIYDIHSKIIYSETVSVNADSESSKKILDIPEISGLTVTYFLDMKLFNSAGKEIDRNFYWLSTKKDVLDYDYKFKDWTYHTPSKEYADLTLLNSLPKVKLNVDHHFEKVNDKQKIVVNLDNENDSIAFFIELQLIDKNSGEVLIPVLWEDNYLSLLPNEERTIEAYFSADKNGLQNLDLRIKGWNLSD
ncbi:Beta-mannosidase [hydrothermal vent metagenome]|uniref:Beta-mannosidase n=1 Tax=hydrothermal vent metagenome TaxID=652676 RepID=A0A3B1CPH7_9ZZZZ